MELKRLTYFLAVSEELHFGRAAARLAIAQPPLSRHIAALEAHLGVQLFDRSRSQIQLTQAGQILQRHARDVLARLDVAYRETRLMGSGAAGWLRIGFVGSASYGLLPSLIKAFRAQYPATELVLSTANNAELHHQLIERSIDIAIARPHLEDDEFRKVELCREKLILAVPDIHEFTSKPVIALTDLKQHTFLLYPRDAPSAYANVVRSIWQRENFVPGRIETVPDFQTAISLVAVGVGVAIVPESVAQGARPGAIFRPFTGHNPGTALTLHARRDNRGPLTSNFLRLAQSFSRSQPDMRSDPLDCEGKPHADADA